jgi:hypothetical protein
LQANLDANRKKTISCNKSHEASSEDDLSQHEGVTETDAHVYMHQGVVPCMIFCVCDVQKPSLMQENIRIRAMMNQ